MKILKVCFKPSFQDEYDACRPYYYFVGDDFETKIGSLILVEPKIVTDSQINLQLALVLDIIESEHEGEDGIVVVNKDVESFTRLAKTPVYIASLDLSDYIEKKKKIKRKKELEKILKDASKNLEQITLFKALSDLKPEYKPLVDEYLNSDESLKLLK